MAVTMQLENIETALVYEYLLSKDTSLAKVFGSKFKVVGRKEFAIQKFISPPMPSVVQNDTEHVFIRLQRCG